MKKEIRLIDAYALIEDIEKRYCEPCKAEGKDYCEVACRACWVDDMILEIDPAPTVDAVKVVHGYWIKHEYAEEENGLLVPNYECSACHSWERDEGYYCPNCGAKMDGERKDNEN